MTPVATIVIPTYNRVDLLARCLASPGLSSLTESAEIVIADNGSTDGTAEYLAARRSIHIVNLPHGTSFARSCNAAAAIASSSRLVFLNNDMLLDRGWLEPLIAWLERPDVGAVGSVLRYPSGDIQHAGVCFSADGLPGNVRLSRRMFRAGHIFLQAVTGAALAIRNDTFHRIGSFDERFRNSYEDVDLCVRLRRMGKRNVLVTSPAIVHFESQTDGRHAHDAANLRTFVAKWSRSCVPDERRILARLEAMSAPVEVIRLQQRSTSTRCADAVTRERLGQSQADTIVFWQGDHPPSATDGASPWPLAARTPVSYWNGQGDLVGVAFARRQVEHVGLPSKLTVRGVVDRLRAAYVDARVRVSARPRRQRP